jgi:hypothetical protein
VLLGRQRGLWQQQRVYRSRDYLEVDSMDGYDVTRRRIFYDEIVLVTLHSAMGGTLAIAYGLLALLLGLLAYVLRGVAWSLAAPALLCCLACWAFVALRLIRPVQTVTVFGKRTRAPMSFWPNTARGREVYLLVCRLAQERQTQIAGRPMPPDTPAGAVG